MKFDIITLFPEMFAGPLQTSIIGRGQKMGLLEVVTHQLRDYSLDKHHTTDDTTYGGGPGMVMKVDVVDEALSQILCQLPASELKNHRGKGIEFYGGDPKRARIVMMSATGKRFTQQKAIELSHFENIILLCGHYEGFDYRVHEHLVDEEISIGDYVLTGGEIPAMVVVDTVSRMVPGVIKEESIMSESFMIPQNQKTKIICRKNECLQPTTYNLQPVFDYPVYTRPVEYKGWRVPEVLQSGNHAEIDKWREENRKK